MNLLKRLDKGHLQGTLSLKPTFIIYLQKIPIFIRHKINFI